MTILEELKQYAIECIEDKIISCQKHKWACQRFLNDLKRIGNDDFPYIWDEDKAQNIYDWFTFLRHSKGILAGQPIFLTISQKFDICQLYGWRDKNTGYKRFKKSFKEVARKNAKSQEEAGVSLYETSVTATEMQEVYETYTAGTKSKQSRIVFEECKLMLKGSPLRSKFRITKDRIEHIKTGSFIEPLSKADKDSGDGTNPACFIIDRVYLSM